MGALHVRGRNAIASRMLAAIERRIGDFQQMLSYLSLPGWRAIERAEAEARRDSHAPILNTKGSARNVRAQLARDLETLLITGLGQYDREFLPTNARHPIDTVPQSLLQTSAELPQNLIATGVAEAVIEARMNPLGAPINNGTVVAS